MPPRNLIIIGGGEHAAVVGEAARSRSQEEWSVAAVVDPSASSPAADRLKVPRLSSDALAFEHIPGAVFILGIGGIASAPLRRTLATRYAKAGASWAVVCHQTAWVSPTATVQPGTVVMAGAVVQSGARIGAHCILNTGTLTEHDVELGDFTHVAPGAAIGGGTRVGRDAFLGLGCRIRDHICLGDGCVAAMGAVVVSDLPAHARVGGVPARILS